MAAIRSGSEQKAEHHEHDGEQRKGTLCEGGPRLVRRTDQQHQGRREHRPDAREYQGHTDCVVPNTIDPMPTAVTIARNRL